MRATEGGSFVRSESCPSAWSSPNPSTPSESQKVSWGDPVMRAKLANAYARAGGDDEKAARILGVTLGSARLAKRRHLSAETNNNREKAS